MFVRVKKTGDYQYLQIVHNYRDGGKPKQKVIATLGRVEELLFNGSIESILESLGRFCQENYLVITNKSEIQANSRIIGPALIFERLWIESGFPEIIDNLIRSRKFEFDMERAIFLTVLNRLMQPGSDRNCEYWRKGYQIDGTENLELHHLYRAMGFLGEPIADQRNNTQFSPRCTKDRIEEKLFDKRRNLFSQTSMVFFDTTSLYFEGEGGSTIGQRGHTKDSRPDLKQMIVGAVLDEKGIPICCELWPGNTADISTLIPIIDRIRSRFNVMQFCIVADRGMFGEEVIRNLELRGINYILGSRMRKSQEVKYQVLTRAGRYQEIYPEVEDREAPSPLKIKEVRIDDHRYVVCVNERQARKDKADREAIISALEEKIGQGPKQFIGNKGFSKFLKIQKGSLQIDMEKIQEEARYDGKWVLRTNSDLDAREVALQYKELWMVEQIFRTTKTILETRPIFHQKDETIRGHVFCSFLALFLQKMLFQKLSEKGINFEWSRIKLDLEQLTQVELEKDGRLVKIRTECKGICAGIFSAVGVALPPTMQTC